jgi:hypothetical protein
MILCFSKNLWSPAWTTLKLRNSLHIVPLVITIKKKQKGEGLKRKLPLPNPSSPPSLPLCLPFSMHRPQRNTAEPQITVGWNSYLIMTSLKLVKIYPHLQAPLQSCEPKLKSCVTVLWKIQLIPVWLCQFQTETILMTLNSNLIGLGPNWTLVFVNSLFLYQRDLCRLILPASLDVTHKSLFSCWQADFSTAQ